MASPLEDFEKTNSKRWTVLVDVPNWEMKSIFNWLYRIYVSQSTDVFGTTHSNFNSGIINTIESNNRLMISPTLKINVESWPDLRSSLLDAIKGEPRRFVLFLELTIKYLRDTVRGYVSYGSVSRSTEQVLETLESFLNNGSKWQVVFAKGSSAGLIERVNQQLLDVAISLHNADIQEAWHEAFQPTPNPEKAIEKAQSAIEAIASKNGLTNATTKVYGSLIGDIKANQSKSYISVAKPAFDLSNVLAGEKSAEIDVNDQFALWFYTGLNLVQKTNPARHKSKKTTNFKVSPEAAKQAVLIATLLSQLINDKYIAKVTKKANQSKKSDG